MVQLQCGSIVFHSVEAVIFDKDGTLANSQRFLRDLGSQRASLIAAQFPVVEPYLLQAFGVTPDGIDPAGLMAVGTRQENEIAAAAYITALGYGWIESLTQAQRAFSSADTVFGRKAELTPLLDGTLDLILTLVKAGIKLGIISADTPANVQDFVQFYELDLFIPVAIGSELGLSKPNPGLLLQACDLLNTVAAKTIVIGDSKADIELACAANAAGCVGVTWGGANLLDLTQATVVVHSPLEIRVLN